MFHLRQVLFEMQTLLKQSFIQKKPYLKREFGLVQGDLKAFWRLHRWAKESSGWGTQVYLWQRIHFNIWQN